ncbi:MAG: hypothetical protein M3066_11060 [Actinomycetota bacterium]|nr:hypothetical protein [Actinomycetota bacterium]
MAADDLFKRYLEVGATMLGMSRERAEGIVRDLVASGEVAKGQATKAADWLVERGRTGGEELKELIRGEVRQQVAALGLATREDIARLESRMDAAAPAAPGATGLAATPRATHGPAAAPTRQPRKAAAVAKNPKPASGDDAAAGTAVGAGITRSGSVRRRGAAAGAGPPGAAPPAGEAVPPKD